jgi:hypothetical protein
MQTLDINGEGEYKIMNDKVITFEEVEERLKGKGLNEYTYQDTIDRYVAYGDAEEFENIEVQKLLLRYNLVEELIYSMATIITDEEVIQGILQSNIVNSTNFVCVNGRIEKLEFVEDEELTPKGTLYMIIHFKGNNNKKYIIKHIYYGAREEKYKNEIEASIGQNITVIAEEYNSGLSLCCLLRNDRIDRNSNLG